MQAKSQENLKEVTHKVYFDVEIDGKPAGMLLPFISLYFFPLLYGAFIWMLDLMECYFT